VQKKTLEVIKISRLPNTTDPLTSNFQINPSILTPWLTPDFYFALDGLLHVRASTQSSFD